MKTSTTFRNGRTAGHPNAAPRSGMGSGVHALVVSALIAAIYAVLSLALSFLSFGPVQVRVAEALTLLPVFSPVAIAGVTLGCFVTNLVGFFTGANILGPLDMLFGTAATLTAALLSYWMRRLRIRGLAIPSAIPPVLVNALVVGAELTVLFSGGFPPGVFAVQALQVGAGQLLSCALGVYLIWYMERRGLDQKLFAPPPRSSR